MGIPEHFIADLKARTDIVELIGECVKLRKAGREYSGCCPFHDDRSPSFTVNPDKQVFHCFGCDAAGGVVDFVMKRHELSFPDAVEHLAQRLGVPVEREASRARIGPRMIWANTQPSVKAHEDAAEPEPLPQAWLDRLRECQERLPEAQAYLDQRRIPLELARSLGAGVGDWRGLRLILPHTDPAGRIVSLYGRRIDGGDTLKHLHLEGRAKGFLNAPVVSSRELWICEGAFDAMALMAAGIPNAVAVFGVQGIRWNWLRSVRRIVLAFDCDEAGRKAIENNAKQCLLRGLEVLQVMPDELGGAKDIAEAWASGSLRLSNDQADAPVSEAQRLLTLLAGVPHSPPNDLPAMQWAEFRARCSRFLLDHGGALAGWTDRELFAIPNPDLEESGGALWSIRCDVAEVTPQLIRCTNGETVQHERIADDGWLSHTLPW